MVKIVSQHKGRLVTLWKWESGKGMEGMGMGVNGNVNEMETQGYNAFDLPT